MKTHSHDIRDQRSHNSGGIEVSDGVGDWERIAANPDTEPLMTTPYR